MWIVSRGTLSLKYEIGTPSRKICKVQWCGHRNMKKSYLLNAFSIQMLDLTSVVEVRFEPIEALPPLSEMKSAVGHPDTAAVLGVKPNRVNVSLNKGDIAYVAQLVGGRLPEGATTLPKGFKFKYFKVTIL